MLQLNKIYNTDCLEGMKQIDSSSIDLILCDLPYGVTQNKKDKSINLEKLWIQYKRIIKPNGSIILHAQFPFTLDLILSNRPWFRYDLIWDKCISSGFLNANVMPLRIHEHILVFYKTHGTYNPQFTKGQPLHSRGHSYKTKELKNQNYGAFNPSDDKRAGSTKKYPTSIIKIHKPHPSQSIHRTQKPIALAEYLIKTYSNKNDLVLDNCMGSGTTAIACKYTNRNYIGFELDKEYYDLAVSRLQSVTTLSSWL